MNSRSQPHPEEEKDEDENKVIELFVFALADPLFEEGRVGQ